MRSSALIFKSIYQIFKQFLTHILLHFIYFLHRRKNFSLAKRECRKKCFRKEKSFKFIYAQLNLDIIHFPIHFLNGFSAIPTVDPQSVWHKCLMSTIFALQKSIKLPCEHEHINRPRDYFPFCMQKHTDIHQLRLIYIVKCERNFQ